MYCGTLKFQIDGNRPKTATFVGLGSRYHLNVILYDVHYCIAPLFLLPLPPVLQSKQRRRHRHYNPCCSLSLHSACASISAGGSCASVKLLLHAPVP